MCLLSEAQERRPPGLPDTGLHVSSLSCVYLLPSVSRTQFIHHHSEYSLHLFPPLDFLFSHNLHLLSRFTLSLFDLALVPNLLEKEYMGGKIFENLCRLYFCF